MASFKERLSPVTFDSFGAKGIRNIDLRLCRMLDSCKGKSNSSDEGRNDNFSSLLPGQDFMFAGLPSFTWISQQMPRTSGAKMEIQSFVKRRFCAGSIRKHSSLQDAEALSL